MANQLDTHSNAFVVPSSPLTVFLTVCCSSSSTSKSTNLIFDPQSPRRRTNPVASLTTVGPRPRFHDSLHASYLSRLFVSISPRCPDLWYFYVHALIVSSCLSCPLYNHPRCPQIVYWLAFCYHPLFVYTLPPAYSRVLTWTLPTTLFFLTFRFIPPDLALLFSVLI